jgi:hypothetical protein
MRYWTALVFFNGTKFGREAAEDFLGSMVEGDCYVHIRYFIFLQLSMSVDIVSEIR